MKSTLEILKNAKAAEAELGILATDIKNAALLTMADEIEGRADEILTANALDIENAQGKIADVMIDRLRLDKKRILAMAQGIREVAALPDPVGSVLEENTLYNGLSVVKKRVPLGVIGIIYESAFYSKRIPLRGKIRIKVNSVLPLKLIAVNVVRKIC